MNSSKINDWLTLIANVAVVGAIVFLAIELHQNNELLRSGSRQTLVANDVTSLAANLNHSKGRGRMWWNEIGRGIVDAKFAQLTLADFVAIAAYTASLDP